MPLFGNVSFQREAGGTRVEKGSLEAPETAWFHGVQGGIPEA